MDKNNLENTLPENEYTTFEERVYGNPNLQVDETNTFIDKLRETQRQNNAEINTQTRDLGTQVPSNLGGLTGGQGYWTSRYQTPQTNSAVATLKEAARAAALKEALANEKAVWDKRYKDAYRAYQKRQSNNQNTGTTGQTVGGVDYKEDPNSPTETFSLPTTDLNYNSLGDFIAGKGAETISYTVDGDTYYANVHRQTGFGTDRYTGMDTSEGLSYEGQHALDYLNKVVANGGKIYSADGEEITPYRALTGSNGR